MLNLLQIVISKLKNHDSVSRDQGICEYSMLNSVLAIVVAIIIDSSLGAGSG